MPPAARIARDEGGASTKSRPRFVLPCAVLLAVAALALCPARAPLAQTLRHENFKAGKDPATLGAQQSALSLKANPSSVANCPGGSALVRLRAVPAVNVQMAPAYGWKVDAGTLEAKADSAVWNLSGVKPGTYTAAVTVKTFRLSVMTPDISASTRVTIRPCRDNTPACPRFTMSCPAMVTAGDLLKIGASWEGGRPVAKPTFEWRLTGGAELVGGSLNERELVLNTTGVKDEYILAAIYLNGYGKPCVGECRILIQQPVATTTPTVTPTPTASTEGTPALTPGSNGTPGVRGARSNWLWLILAGLVALCVVAFLAAKLFSFSLLGHLKGAPAGLGKVPPGPVSPSTGGAHDAVVGSQKKEADKVHCTVFAPEQAAPGDPFQVQVFAHLAKHSGRLKKLAARAHAEAEEQGSAALRKPVARGTEITFTLRMEGLEVQGSQKSLVWDGAINHVQFAVDVPKDCERTNIRGEVNIYYGKAKAPVGEIIFMFKVAGDGAAASAPTAPPQRHVRYRHAFVSYCAKDLDKVLLGLRGLRAGWEQEGITYFFDRRGIDAGAYWPDVIKAHLDRCDLFVLFWSSAAQCSGEVGKEIAYARARRLGSYENLPAIVPFTLEKPIPKPLPEGLESIHFGDELLNYGTDEETP